MLVDIVWLGEFTKDVQSISAGLYEMIHRNLGLERAEGSVVIPDETHDPTSPKGLLPIGHEGTLSLPEGALPGAPARYWTRLTGQRDVDVPVFIGRPVATVLEEAQGDTASTRVVVIIIDDSGLKMAGAELDLLLSDLEQLEEAGALVLEIPLSQDALVRLGSRRLPLRNHLFPPSLGTAPVRPRQEFIDEGVAIELCHRLGVENASNRVRVFISHAKSDLGPTKGVAQQIKNHLNNHTRLGTFFDAQDLPLGADLDRELDQALEHVLLLCVSGDEYGDSPYCQREMLVAKRRGLPVLSVSCLQLGEARSLSFGGNHRRLQWPAEDDRQQVEDALALITRECVRAMLHHLHFLKVADQVQRFASLRVSRTISRNPEALDLGTGVIPPERSSIVLYPDPPMSYVEAEPLAKANPRCLLATPSTLLGWLDHRSKASAEGEHNPSEIHEETLSLGGLRVAFSMSRAEEDAPSLFRGMSESGVTQWHLDEVIAQVALTLLRSGASLGYGGHLAVDGFTQLLVDVIERHKRMTASPTELVRSYLVPASQKLAKGVTGSYIVEVPLLDGEASPAWEFSQMRAYMANHEAAAPPPDVDRRERVLLEAKKKDVCHARVCMGGKVRSYGGAFPGIAEEAWWMVASPPRLQDPKPLYVLGGFGGAARAVADALDPDVALPQELSSASREKDEEYQKKLWTYLREAKAANWTVPTSLDDLAQGLRAYGKRLRESGTAHNGLTWEENLRLFRSTSPLEVSSLVLKGLLNWRYHQRERSTEVPLPVVAWRGNVLQANVQALGFATLSDAERSGLDREILRVAARDVDEPGGPAPGTCTVIGMPSNIGARYALWGGLGTAADLEGEDPVSTLEQRTFAVAEAVASEALKRGLRVLAVVPFATTLGLPVTTSVRAIVRGIRAAEEKADVSRRFSQIVFSELDGRRYRSLLRALEDLGSTGALEVTEHQPQAGVEERDLPIVMRVTSPDQTALEYEVDLPGLAVPVRARVEEPNWEQIGAFRDEAETISADPKLKTASLARFEALGEGLAKVAFPSEIREPLAHDSRPIEVRHDGMGGRVPLELLRAVAKNATNRDRLGFLALRGLTRRPINLTPSLHHAQRDLLSRLKILMVCDPTEDLPGTRKEQERLQELLEGRVRIQTKILSGGEAKMQTVLEALQEGPAVLHYAGHAFLDEHAPEESGLELADGVLRASDLQSLPPGKVPSLVFLNACESARGLWDVGADGQPVTVAERFLAAGVQNLLGSLWEVRDDAAKDFAEAVYSALLEGRTLGVAALWARRRLLQDERPDCWNYMLYGQPGTRLVSTAL